MRALIDTNVLIDFLAKRSPYYADAEKIITLCSEDKIDCCVAAHSVTDAFYILRKSYSISERREILSEICRLFTVVGIDKEKLIKALKNDGFKDMEDCLQYECAVEYESDYIITRNGGDFGSSEIPVITPEKFIARYI